MPQIHNSTHNSHLIRVSSVAWFPWITDCSVVLERPKRNVNKFDCHSEILCVLLFLESPLKTRKFEIYQRLSAKRHIVILLLTLPKLDVTKMSSIKNGAGNNVNQKKKTYYCLHFPHQHKLMINTPRIIFEIKRWRGCNGVLSGEICLKNF